MIIGLDNAIFEQKNQRVWRKYASEITLVSFVDYSKICERELFCFLQDHLKNTD